MTIGKIMGKIVKMLPKTEGTAGKITLGRTQLKYLAKEDQKAAIAVQKTLENVKNPKLDIAYKAESNYAIAGMRLRDGKKVIGQGAVSITNPGSSEAVLKYRASAKDALQANGFIDGGKVADGKDIAVSLSRKGGKVKSDLEIGQAARNHVEFDEQKAVDLAKDFDAGKLLEEYTKATRNLQTNLDGAMVNVRKMFRGDVSGPQVSKYSDEVKKAANWEPLKKVKLEKSFSRYSDEVEKLGKAKNDKILLKYGDEFKKIKEAAQKKSEEILPKDYKQGQMFEKGIWDDLKISKNTNDLS